MNKIILFLSVLSTLFFLSCSSDSNENELVSSSSVILFSSSSSEVVYSSFLGESSSSHIIIDTFIDNRDDNIYKWTKVGEQIWMAENLNYNVQGSKCYDDKPDNCENYGKLYDWSMAMDFSNSCNSSICSSKILINHQGICPNGWHIPSDDEWATLITYAGVNAGTKLKATSWSTYSMDEFGFSALPGGIFNPNNPFNEIGFLNIGNENIWWSASENDANGVLCRSIHSSNSNVYRNNHSKSYMFSVRCVRDIN